MSPGVDFIKEFRPFAYPTESRGKKKQLKRKIK
jgi:hypothetical protein